MNSKESSINSTEYLSLEVGILRNRMLEILEDDPWNKQSLITLSEIEFGDASRLYRIDALKSDTRDIDLAKDTIIWEINEEMMGSKKNDISRLSARLSAIFDIILDESRDTPQMLFDIIENSIRELEGGGKTKEIILGLKALLVLENDFPNIMQATLSINLPCTKTVIVELLRGKGTLSDELSRKLLISIANSHYLYTDLRIRQIVSQTIFDFGDYELAFWLSMKSTEINPQDATNSVIGLDAAINMGDDEKILSAAGVALSMKKEPKGIRYEKISSAAIRLNRTGYAKDLLLRRRMVLNLEGHRQRVGIYYHEGDSDGVFEELARTPKPYCEHDSMLTYNTLSLIISWNKKAALESIDEISDPLERGLLKYYYEHHAGNYEKAIWALNRHFSKNKLALISDSWAKKDCKFLEIMANNTPKSSENHGKVSVIMTCHRYNEALPMAINSVSEQSYPDVQFIFVDDHSPKKDVKIYDQLLEGIDVTRIRMPKNSGTYACRNAGIIVAEGDFITFADSDDWVNPEKISNSIDFLVSNSADLVVGRYVRMSEDGTIIWNGIRFARFALMGMTFRASALKDVLIGFDERMRHSADSELFERARIILGENKVKRYPTIEVIAFESGSNLTSEGGLAIDWVGTSGDRVKYSESYRRWHQVLKDSRNPPKTDYLSFAIGGDNSLESEMPLRGAFGYIETSDNTLTFSEVSDESILVTMCTYPGGFATVGRAIASLLYDQSVPITQLRLTINGRELPDNLPIDDRLVVILSETDVTDRGKFIEIGSHEGYVITTDDDINYPSDYVETMIGHVDRFARSCLIGVHGAHIPEGPPITRWWEYMNFRRSLIFTQEMPTFIPVNVIGTGTLAFHTDAGKPNPEDFDYQRMVDLHFAVWAQRNHVPMRICPRRRNWLQEIQSGYIGTIWDTVKDDSALQHRMLEVLRRVERWTLFANRDWGPFNNSGVFEEFGNWDNRELCPGMVLPKQIKEFPAISEDPLVTIYMPTYNCADFIIDSINSALNQTYKNTEICVHDDGSTDRTLSIIKRKYRFSRKVRISSATNGGIGSASNSAIRGGKGELILQLDSDDLLHPKALEELIPLMGKGIVCAYGSFNRIGTDGEEIDDGWDWPEYSHPRLMRSMIVHHPRLFRRDAWATVGGFDEDLENGVDYDFFLKLGEIGMMGHTSEKLYSYRIHDASTSQDKYDLQTRNTYLVQQYALNRMGLDEFTNYAPNSSFPRRIHYSFSAFLNRHGV